MKQYESYMNRRVPVDVRTDTSGNPLTPYQIARDRLYAIRDIMRMEMPDRQNDFIASSPPIVLPHSQRSVPVPPITRLYQQRFLTFGAGNGNPEDLSAELLYAIVSMGTPEAMEQFSASEVGDYDENGLPEFLDAWGRPISFLRWAPGFSSLPDGAVWTAADVISASPIQIANPATNHDPFDPRKVDARAYYLIPLIYSAGPDGKAGIEVKGAISASNPGYYFQANASTQDMFADPDFKQIGTASNAGGTGTLTDYHDNITNHNID
jgi:hypothetical protein